MNEETEDDLDFSIEFHIDNNDCIACIKWQTKSKNDICITCSETDEHCYFQQDTELQIMKNITNFNEGFK